MENNLEQPNLETENTSSANQEGSSFGKFKDAESLLNAYNSLQAEFTRKSQKLSEFQSYFDNNAIFSSKSIDEILKESTDKDEYKKEITEMLSNDKELDNLPNKYQVAFKILETSKRKLAEKLNNPTFIDEMIMSNENIKNNIIENYLLSLNNIPAPPNISCGNSSQIYFTPKDNKPLTIRDAGEIFSKMLK